MVEIRTYQLPPTRLMPNSPLPLIHYVGFVKPEDCTPLGMHDLYERNGWQTQWIVRYGPTQRSHYHGDTHECMTVLRGSAKIRFGVADTTEDMDGNTYGGMHEEGGIELAASAGDVFILPAGLAHKTYDTLPAGELKLLTPGKGEGVEADDPRRALAKLVLDGFTMMGSYPFGGKWNFAVGGEDEGNFERVWGLARPPRDPVLGESEAGLCGLWASADCRSTIKTTS